jgi:hypothetical protein
LAEDANNYKIEKIYQMYILENKKGITQIEKEIPSGALGR